MAGKVSAAIVTESKKKADIAGQVSELDSDAGKKLWEGNIPQIQKECSDVITKAMQDAVAAGVDRKQVWKEVQRGFSSVRMEPGG